MKALVYEAPHTLRFGDRPPPTAAAAADVLINVAAAGICGSDMHAFMGHDERRPPPLILGHEAAGETDGQKVIVNPLTICQNCDYCRHGCGNLCRRREIISMPPREGAFAEMLTIPRTNIVPLPPQLSMLQGALTEPLACGHHAAALAQKHCRQPIEECAATILGGGAIGLAAALSLTARGIKTIYILESNPLRIPVLQKIGDFIVAPPDKPPPATDIVIDAVGAKSTRQMATEITRAGGVVVHIGLAEHEGGFNMRHLTLHEITLCGSYTYTAEEFAETAKWMATGQLGALDWFETRPLKDGARAFAELLQGKITAPKIILTP